MTSAFGNLSTRPSVQLTCLASYQSAYKLFLLDIWQQVLRILTLHIEIMLNNKFVFGNAPYKLKELSCLVSSFFHLFKVLSL